MNKEVTGYSLNEEGYLFREESEHPLKNQESESSRNEVSGNSLYEKVPPNALNCSKQQVIKESYMCLVCCKWRPLTCSNVRDMVVHVYTKHNVRVCPGMPRNEYDKVVPFEHMQSSSEQPGSMSNDQRSGNVRYKCLKCGSRVFIVGTIEMMNVHLQRVHSVILRSQMTEQVYKKTVHSRHI